MRMTNMTMRALCACTLFWVAGTAGAARAQDGAAEQTAQDETEATSRNELARDAYEEGSAHFEAERYQEALDAFRRSYDYDRLPALLFNMGSALDRLGRPEQAIARYEAYLVAMEEDANAPYVRSRIRLLQAELSEANPDEVQSDGPVEPGQLDDPVHVPVTPATETPSRVGPIVLLAVGAAALATALGTGLRARSLDGDVRDQCTGNVCPGNIESDARRVTRLARTTDAMAGVAGAALLSGVLWWVLSGGDEDAPRASATCGPRSCEAQVRLTF